MGDDLERARSDGQMGRVLLIAPSPPPYGGMAIQARLLEGLLRADGNEVVFSASNLPFPKWLKFAGWIYGVRTMLRSLMVWMAFVRQIPRADVVHILAASRVYFFVVVCPAIFLGRLCGKRVVLNYRGGDARKFFGWSGWLLKPVFGLATVITAPSRFVAQAIEEHFGREVLIVPNILDKSIFRPRRRTRVQPKLLVSRHLEKIYDVETALKAFQVVQASYPEATLWIAGTGSQAEYLRNQVEVLQLRNVRFLGYIAHRDLGPIYDQCDILLNSSRVDNFPGSLLEASGAGLVVVSTGAGGIPHMFQHGRTALLVEPGDWQALGQAVLQVLDRPELALELTTEASAVARKSDWSEVRKLLYRTYGFASREQVAVRVGMQ